MKMSIEVEEWQDKVDEQGKPTGFVSYVKQKSLEQVELQLRAVLKSMHFETWGGDAFGAAEWISTNRDLEPEGIFPKGEPVVLFREGSNEGYLLQVLSHDRSCGKFVPVFSIKYLTDEECVWSVVKAVSKAFRNAN